MRPIDYMNIIRETQRLVIRPTREEDFVAIRDGLRSQGSQQNKFDDEEHELADNYTEYREVKIIILGE